MKGKRCTVFSLHSKPAMLFRNASTTIRQIRQSLGKTQEDFSKNVCDVVSLSRIESGLSGISPNTFKRLMSQAGLNTKTYPEFQSKKDFHTFRLFQNFTYSINSWRLTDALAELQEIILQNYGDNKSCFCHCLIYVAELLIKSGYSKINVIQDYLNQALCQLELENPISPHYIDSQIIQGQILLAECFLQQGNLNSANQICSFLKNQLTHQPLSQNEKFLLIGKNAVLQIKLALKKNDYHSAYSYCKDACHMLQKNHVYSPLLEVWFLWSISAIKLELTQEGLQYFDVAFYSSFALSNGFSDLMLKYIQVHFPHITLNELDYPYQQTHNAFKKIHDYFDSTSLTFYPKCSEELKHYLLGDIIYNLRVDAGITQTQLCKGLCSKSKLSKIENNQLMPDCFLSEALFERLGLQSNMFCIFTSKKDCQIKELKENILSHEKNKVPTQTDIFMQKLAPLISSKDILNKQWFDFFVTKRTSFPDTTTYVDFLKDLLIMTSPNWKPEDIPNDLYTYNELSILNRIAVSLVSEPQSLITSCYYFNQLLSRLRNRRIDHMIFSKTYAVTISRYISALAHISYQETVRIFKEYAPLFGLQDCRTFSHMLFYYCQVLFELKEHPQAILYTKMALAVNKMIGQNTAVSLLQNSIKEEYGIEL